MSETVYYCECGCGTQIVPSSNGRPKRFIKNHHRKGVSYTLEQRLERMKKRWKKEPILSPYVPNLFITFDKRLNRWKACFQKENGKYATAFHSQVVYKHYFGNIQAGYVVHHKDGKHHNINDDRPENLMLLPDEWNLRFFPVLAKGFGLPEKEITEAYCLIFDNKLDNNKLFSKLCQTLIRGNKCQ